MFSHISNSARGSMAPARAYALIRSSIAGTSERRALRSCRSGMGGGLVMRGVLADRGADALAFEQAANNARLAAAGNLHLRHPLGQRGGSGAQFRQHAAGGNSGADVV